MNIKRDNFSTLEEFLISLGVQKEDLAELESAIRVDQVPVRKDKLGTKVGAWVGKMTSKAANGTWQVGLGAATNLLAEAFKRYYGL